MEVDPVLIDHYSKILALSATGFVGAFVITKLSGYIIKLLLLLLLLSAGVFGANMFLDVDTSNIDIKYIWLMLSHWFAIVVKFFATTLNNGGLMVIVAMVLGVFIAGRGKHES